MPQRKTIFERLQNDTFKKGKIRVNVLLNAYAEQVHVLAGEHRRMAKEHEASAAIIDKVASAIELHALTHIGDSPSVLSKQDLKMLRAMPAAKRARKAQRNGAA